MLFTANDLMPIQAQNCFVAPLMEILRAARYRLWYDRNEIHLGDPHWQARIDQGLGQCDGGMLQVTDYDVAIHHLTRCVERVNLD